MQGLYIHIPFCEAICHYCDFVKKVPKNNDQTEAYLEALIKEIEKTKLTVTHVDTIYIGGGTPSMLSVEQLKRLFEALKSYHPIEYTFEVNPESYAHDKGELFKLYGINRISFGVQTFSQHHLKRLNRKHTNQMVFNGIQDLKSLGIHNISVDLIYALENQTPEELKEDLNTLIALDIPHVSAYSLILEEKTYFHYQYKRGTFIPADEDTEATMYDIVIDTLTNAGYTHYEISNFGKPGNASLHNMLYWTQQPYIGLGVGAHGFDGTFRTQQTKSLSKYIKGEPPTKTLQDPITLQNDYLLFKLRMTEGIDLNMVTETYGASIFELYPSLHKYVDEGLLVVSNNHLKLTRKGLQLGNLVFMVFV